MAKSVRGGDNAELAVGSSATLTWPASVGANDIAYIFASYYKTSIAASPSTPTNFVSLLAETGIDAGGGTGATKSCIIAWYKECGTESGDISVAFNQNVYANVILVVFAGDGDLTHASAGSVTTAQSTTDATASAVSATNGQLLVGLYGLSDPPGTTNAAPSGMSLAQDGVNTGANSARIYWQSITSTASTGDKTWDFSNTRNVGAFLALADDAGGGGGGGVPKQMDHILRLTWA